MMFVIDSEMFKKLNCREVSHHVFEMLNDKGEVIDTIKLTYKEAHDEEGRYYVVEQNKYNKIMSFVK
jgi:hypothetical protein